MAGEFRAIATIEELREKNEQLEHNKAYYVREFLKALRCEECSATRQARLQAGIAEGVKGMSQQELDEIIADLEKPLSDDELLLDEEIENRKLKAKNKLQAERIEELEEWQRQMVEKAADESLDGYREMGAKCVALEEQKDKLKQDNATLRATAELVERGSPNDIRAKGWAVAVHNDYRVAGSAHTFWLFTKDGHALKGEGLTDIDALIRVREALEALGDST